jgi:hypothetical protein
MPVFRGAWSAQHGVIADHFSVGTTAMHTMQSCLNCLTKIISFAAQDETSSATAQPELEQAPSIEQAIRRARMLLARVESTGVKFPSQVHDALERARVAQQQDRWMIQVERDFCDALSLLESIARPQSQAAMKPAGFPGNIAHQTDDPGWTVIISSRRKALDGSW